MQYLWFVHCLTLLTKICFDITYCNLYCFPLSGSMTAINTDDQMKYATEFDMSSHLLNGKFNGFVDKSGKSVSSQLNMEYTYSNNPIQTISFQESFLDRSGANDIDYNFDRFVHYIFSIGTCVC